MIKKSDGYDNNIILLVIGAFFALSCMTLLDSTKRAYKRRKWVDIIQSVAALCQAVNTMTFGLQLLYVGFDCPSITFIPTGLYFVFQILSTSIVIYQATVILPDGKTRTSARMGLALLFLVGMILIFISCYLATVTVDDKGKCIPIFQREWNVSGKSIVGICYLLALILFLVPLYRHMKSGSGVLNGSSGKMLSMSEGGKHRGRKNSLVQVMTNVSTRLLLAILCYLLTAALSLANVFGVFFFVEFCIQNYSAIVASNLCSEQDNNESESNNSVSFRSNSKSSFHVAAIMFDQPIPSQQPPMSAYLPPRFAPARGF